MFLVDLCIQKNYIADNAPSVAQHVIVVVCDRFWVFSFPSLMGFLFFLAPAQLWYFMTLLFADVFYACVCDRVGCLHPNYAEVGCVLFVFVFSCCFICIQ